MSYFHLSEECQEEIFFFQGSWGRHKLRGGFLEERSGQNKEDRFKLVVGVWRMEQMTFNNIEQ